jgi:hypothetical protein
LEILAQSPQAVALRSQLRNWLHAYFHRYPCAIPRGIFEQNRAKSKKLLL